MKPMRTIGLAICALAVIFFLFSTQENSDTSEIQEIHATVLSTDDSGLVHSGVCAYGAQVVEVQITDAPWNGKIMKVNNHLLGKADIDTLCEPGENIILGIQVIESEIRQAKILEHDRTVWLLGLTALFIICLIGYAGMIGLKALVSFTVSVWILWEVLVKGLLAGEPPLPLVSFVIILLSAIIIFSVAGFTKKGFSAFLGTSLGLGFSVVLTILFGKNLHINGMTLPFAEALIFNGNLNLNMHDIFYGAVLLGASGASMDIAMDVAASMAEIKNKRPDIGMRELIQSGISIGRHVIGTMSTTLLLAYSGGFITLLMLFMTMNTKFIRIVTLKIVASEIMRTLIGSINLILVAPLTALIAGILLCHHKTFFSKSESSSGTLAEEHINV